MHFHSLTEKTLCLHLMLYMEIIAVYCENHLKHIHLQCGQNAGYLLLN
jgi:hypothetical protein